MDRKLIAAFAILALLLAGCAQNVPPTPVATGSGVAPWTDFWTDQYVNFPIINATANYTGNESNYGGFYGTIKLVSITDYGNSTATVLVKNEVGTQFANVSTTALNTTTNRTIATDNYGRITLNVTCRSCSVRIVAKHS